MVERNGETPMNRRLEFRVGIHEGDIVVDEQDIFGDGVNVAARLQALSEPGGICISSRVYEDLAGRLELPFEDQGEQQLKNIARSVRIFCLGKKALAELRTTPSLEDGPNEPTGALQRHQRGPLAWLPTRLMPWRPATPPWTAAFNTRSAKVAAPLHRRGEFSLLVSPFERAAGVRPSSVNCSAALHKSRQRARPGIFRRRHHRGFDRRSGAHCRQLCHRTEHRPAPTRTWTLSAWAANLACVMSSTAVCDGPSQWCGLTPI
jgi:adenylate/guanylate cyclase family protein